jgi:hypothetical protein
MQDVRQGAIAFELGDALVEHRPRLHEDDVEKGRHLNPPE